MIFSTSLSMLKALIQIHPHPLPCTRKSLGWKATLPRHPWVGLVSLSINLSASLRSEYLHHPEDMKLHHYVKVIFFASFSVQTPGPNTSTCFTWGLLAFIGLKKQNRTIKFGSQTHHLISGRMRPNRREKKSPNAHSCTVINRKADAREWKT